MLNSLFVAEACIVKDTFIFNQFKLFFNFESNVNAQKSAFSNIKHFIKHLKKVNLLFKKIWLFNTFMHYVGK